jgi:voltage-gated potassium channel
MSHASETTGPTESREERNARRLERWEEATAPIIVVAAILPVAVSLTERGQASPAEWLDLVSWGVFIADLVVHVWLKPGYLRSRLGVFDLTIVVLTAPWYFIPGLDEARFLQLARLGRLGRVFVASSRGSVVRDLGRRLGHASIYSLALIVCCSIVVRSVEPATTGIDTFGDAFWWSLVTFTTVGYGDLVPVTTAGRLAAAFLMLGGVALIGALAGSLSTFFVESDDGSDGQADDPSEEPADETADDRDVQPVTSIRDESAQAPTDASVTAELRRLRQEVAALRSELAATRGPQ